MDKKKILIIDDDIDFVELITIRLVASGYDVISANNGIVGLDKARNENPDLILLDIRMPQIDGHTILRNLKKYGEKTKSIPVIMLTGMKDLEDLFYFEGATDYIAKPFDDKELFSKIEAAVKGKR